MAEFDRYVAIDWSSAARPTTGANSIWVAVADRAGEPELTNPPTRAEAARLLDEIVATAGRVLVGVDASLGYPRGAAECFGLEGEPWRATWCAIADRVTDDDRNANNRFEAAAALNRLAGAAEGPFWGCPSDDLAPALRRTRPTIFPVPEYRLVEQHLRARRWRPKSAWQLLGAGSVGGQALTVLPLLHRQLGAVDVWPFTTGLRCPALNTRVVVAEVWPTWFVRDVPRGVVPDAAQVAATATSLRTADTTGALQDWFEPGNVSGVDRAAVEHEEGWILGVT